jgi:sugar-phosphatase
VSYAHTFDRRFAAVLFDLDGTLIDSTASVNRSWRRWAAEFGITFDGEVPHGLPSATTARRHLPPELVDAGAARMEELEITDTAGIVAYPGVLGLLAALPPGRHGIVTSCTTELAAARMGAAGLTAPPILVTVDQLQRGKPDPEGYRTGAQRLGFDPRDCVVIEDAPGGLAAGRAAGCTTIALTTTTDPGLLAADVVVGSLSDLEFAVEPDGIRVRLATSSH